MNTPPNSKEQSALNRVHELLGVAITLAPACTSGLDFSARGPAWAQPGEASHVEQWAGRAFEAAEAFLAKRDALLMKATAEMAKAAAAKKVEAANG